MYSVECGAVTGYVPASMYDSMLRDIANQKVHPGLCVQSSHWHTPLPTWQISVPTSLEGGAAVDSKALPQITLLVWLKAVR